MSEASLGTDLVSIVALLGAGIIAVTLFKRLGLGSVLGYLAAGLAIGPFGLGLFNAAGMMKAYASGEVSPAFAVVLGAVTGSGGGIIRDVLCGEMPALLRPGELYITTCLAGGVAGVAALWLGASAAVASAIIAFVTIAFRLAAIRFEWKLPAAPWHD